mgnify:CR=1 FL=1
MFWKLVISGIATKTKFLFKKSFIQAVIGDEAIIHEEMEKRQKFVSTLTRNPKLQFLEDITNNFSHEREIGRGSFGVVYKVCLAYIFILY